MKLIQWFPGHMKKAMKTMEENLSLADGVILVLDARCPASSFNPELKKLLGGKPIIYLLNKGDLADERADELLALIRESGAAAIKINSQNTASRRDILGAIEKIVAEKRQKALDKKQTRQFRFIVAGVPNTGKSTLINLLAGGKRAQTGDKAGVTRGKQWINCGGFDLMDTPGTMPPSFKNQTLALRLAYVGSVNDDILDLDDVALSLLAFLAEKYPERLRERYGEVCPTPEGNLNAVCVRRGFVQKGGQYDYDRAIRAVLDDLRKGKLGRITFDEPGDLSGLEF